MKKLKNSIIRFFKLIYVKLFRINDTPQKISLGLGLGVFLGIIPGTGPIASLFLALIFRVNRAAAVLGSLLTNTWLSIVTFILAIKLGATITKVNWQGVQNDWHLFLRDFSWASLFKLSVLKLIFPVIAGYFVIALFLGLVTYLIALIIITRTKKGP